MGRLGLRGRPRREGVVRGLAAQLVGEDGLGGPVWREAQVGCVWPEVQLGLNDLLGTLSPTQKRKKQR